MSGEESLLLLPKGGTEEIQHGAAGDRGWSYWKDRAVTIVVVFAVIMLGLFLWPSSNPSITVVEEDLSLRSQDDGMTPTQSIPIYRPTCKLYSQRHAASVVQTSLGQPSEQWSPVECLEVEIFDKPATSWFTSSTESTAFPVDDTDVNEYGAPDARLKMGGIAHPDRRIPIMGFGGAFTEASALNYESLSQQGKDAVLELLFGKSHGLGYGLGRVHMNSCDFSVGSYSFDETDGDFDLKDFDIGVHHDVSSGMVDMMVRATSVFRESWGDKDGDEKRTHQVDDDTTSSTSDDHPDGILKILASPWSPPAWMKAPTPYDSEDAEHASGMTSSAQPTCLREGVGPDSDYAKAWALYFSKFLTAYDDLGIKLFAITVQNEPEFAAPWEACSYTPNSQSDFVKHHLGPMLQETHPDVQIFIFDHNKDHAPTWVDHLVNDTNPSSQYVSGTGVHWYAGGMDRLLDGAVGNANMHRIMGQLDDFGVKSNHILLGTEACHCPSTGYAGGDINVAWSRAERYAHTVLADLAAGSNGWVEWNLMLDSIGGPNHLQNMCDAPLLAVPYRAVGAGSSIPDIPSFEHADHPFGPVIGDGRTREELNALGFPARYLDVGVVVQPMFYYMGHISRHVRPGSRSLMGLVQHSSRGDDEIFRRKGQVVAGGGENDLARDGVELTAWPCEGSTRQVFLWNPDTTQLQVFGHDWLGKPTTSCVGNKPDKGFEGLTLDSCELSHERSGSFDLVPLPDDGTKVQFVLTDQDPSTGARQCLALKALENGGGAYGPRGGAQVTLGSCNSTMAEWKFVEETGEIMATLFDETVCMTTGWPFLQMGAFETPNNPDADKVVVILNEAKEAANYILIDESSDDDSALLTGSIPPRSIQTISLRLGD